MVKIPNQALAGISLDVMSAAYFFYCGESQERGPSDVKIQNT